ncbi:MAG: restriction endonuclease [Aquiluna sp.]|nr:restriction endonuclease [Aquiluna sp.]
MKISIGQTLKYQKSMDMARELVGDHLNYTHLVSRASPSSKPLLEKGITKVSPISQVEDPVIPAILIRSSPTKKGKGANPWYDVFDSWNGRIEYFGDNKSPGDTQSPGNKILLDQAELHMSKDPEVRQAAAPMVFFEGQKKGEVTFHGFGVIEKVELVTQFSVDEGFFSNYKFTFAVFSLADQEEAFDWGWIDERRCSAALGESHSLAPKSWRTWLKEGNQSLATLRRRVLGRATIARNQQLPSTGSSEEAVLDSVYDYYTNISGKHNFELLSLQIVNSILKQSGASLGSGWVTKASSDRGVDFVTSFRIGSGFATIPVGVVGQAKCELPSSGTGGINLSRTVSRLHRGWVGAYVTTSYFTEASQREVLEDQYPLLLVGGKEVARVTTLLATECGFSQVIDYLRDLDLRKSDWEKNMPIHQIDIYRDL